MWMKKLCYAAIDVLLPAVCPVCAAAAVKYPDPVCGKCKSEIISRTAPGPASSFYIPEIYSCRFYDNEVKECIKQFKYHKKLSMMRLFNEMIQNALGKFYFPEQNTAIIVPVPIHKKRLRMRTFNQAEMVAQSLSETLSLPLCTNILMKTKNTPPQTGLDKKCRKNNLKGSFSVISTASLVNKTIILADDVMTTGATLDACAEKLLHKGVKKVYGFTLARTI